MNLIALHDQAARMTQMSGIQFSVVSSFSDAGRYKITRDDTGTDAFNSGFVTAGDLLLLTQGWIAGWVIASTRANTES